MIDVRTDGSIATVTLSRPAQLNALAGTMREELLEAIGALREDPAVRCLIVTGAGRAFCAGGDLDRLRELRADEDAAELQRLLELGADVALALRACPKPVLAAVNGPAAGAGLALALACDLRIAAASAVFSVAFVRIGLVPDWGTTWLLPRLVGGAAAAEMALTGRRLDAAEALRIGLVHRVVADAELSGAARGWAEELAALPAGALGRIKELLHRSPSASLVQQLADEARAQLDCFAQPDVAERLGPPRARE